MSDTDSVTTPLSPVIPDSSFAPLLFPLGRVLATPAVLEHFEHHKINPQQYFERHQQGDWGDVSPEDRLQNDLSVTQGSRILSAYLIAGQRVWILTEADRFATTLLFPSEY